jgi:methylenetetrahydrofolate reductase (NADPH)
VHISRLIADNPGFISLEYYPPKEQSAWPDFFEVAAKLGEIKPLFVSVTYGAGGSTQDNTLAIATRLKQEFDFEPLVHLTCVGASRQKISDFLIELRKVGIDNVLALRGDPPRGSCDFKPDNEEFQHATDLIRFIKAEFPDFCVGAACYPWPHPQSPTIEDDFKWTKHKIDVGADFLVTQLFFDSRLYADYVNRLKDMGVTAPIVPGVLPILSLNSFRFILSLCGAVIPGNFYLELEKADQEGGAEAVRKIGVDWATNMSKSLLEAGAPGVHLYTLNQAEAILKIVDGL